MSGFYTYIHMADDGEVFYVGKGKGRRAWAHSGRNRSARWHEFVKTRGLKVEVCATWPTEEQAYQHEKFLISCLEGVGKTLLNETKGGGGASGMTQSAKSNALRSAALMGRKRGPEVGQKIGAVLRGRTRAVIPEVEARRISACVAAKAKRVLCVETGEVFDSLSDAARSLNASIAPISMALNGKRDTAHGYHWRLA
jgi:hypothetical protein